MMNQKYQNRLWTAARGWLTAFLLAALLLNVGALAAEKEEKVYQFLPIGSSGDEVLELQTRLMELGYYTDGLQLTPSLFDDATRQALEQFCKTNQIASSGDGASTAIQRLLFSQGVKPYSEPEVKQTLQQKFFGYMAGDVDMFGLGVPVFLVWLLSVALGVLILILAVHFFVPAVDRPAEERQKPQGRYWRATDALRDDTAVMSQRRIHEKAGQQMELQVRYGGSVTNLNCSCPPTVTIGRGACTVVLNSADQVVSSNHCEIYYHGAVPMLRDHSSNGTYLNGKRLHNTECRLNSGDYLRLGEHEIFIQF